MKFVRSASCVRKGTGVFLNIISKRQFYITLAILYNIIINIICIATFDI